MQVLLFTDTLTDTLFISLSPSKANNSIKNISPLEPSGNSGWFEGCVRIDCELFEFMENTRLFHFYCIFCNNLVKFS